MDEIRFGSAAHWAIWLHGVMFGFALGVLVGVFLVGII